MDLAPADVVLAMAYSFAVGLALRGLAHDRQRRGLPPYDRPGFPGPGLWGLLGWLATPIGLVLFCWRFGWRRWLLPALALWWLGMMLLGWLSTRFLTAAG
jgi:hypothetical protein